MPDGTWTMDTWACMNICQYNVLQHLYYVQLYSTTVLFCTYSSVLNFFVMHLYKVNVLNERFYGGLPPSKSYPPLP